MKRLLNYDPVTKTKTYFKADSAGENFEIQTVQDVEDIVALNKAQYNQKRARDRYGDLEQVARIPLFKMFELKKKGIIAPNGDVTNEKEFLKWLQDPANQAWRTRPGRLI